jgi:chaperonin GroES
MAYEVEDDKEEKKSDIKSLVEFADAVNLTDEFEDDDLNALGQKVVEEAQSDLETMADWLKGYDDGLKLASLTSEAKTFPWPGAANIKFPLIANAAIKFNARAYPELVRNSEVVSFKVVGSDQGDQKYKRGQRVSRFMNWQLMEDMRDWDADMDRMLMMLPCVGQMYKKIYYDPRLGRNVSELITGNQLIINTKAPSWDRLRRKTYQFQLYQNEIVELQRAGIFRECELRSDQSGDQPHDEVFDIYEQHRYYDLDGDGYEEPYVVTVDKASSKVLRVKASYTQKSIVVNEKREVVKVTATDFFEPYGFLPSFDGGLLSVGFGHLLLHLNEAANGIINRLLDAGTLANVQGGFIADNIRIKGGSSQFQAGEWKRVSTAGGPIGNSIFPLPVKEPSPTLFNLLGMIIEAANDIAAIKDVLSGDMPSGMNAQPTTVLALIEQGQKTFNAIYKRIWRSLRGELRKLYRLNNEYLDPRQYLMVLDDQELTANPQLAMGDFGGNDQDIVPLADPAISSQAQRMAQTQAVLQLSGRPGIDEYELTREAVSATGHPKTDQLVPPKKEGQPDPAQAQQAAQAAAMQKEMEMRDREVAAKEKEVAAKSIESAAKVLETQARIKNILADAIKKVAEAEALESGQQLDIYRAQLDELYRQVELLNADNQTAVRGMAAPSSDAVRSPSIQPDLAGMQEQFSPEGSLPSLTSMPGPAPDSGGMQLPVGVQ